MDTHIQDTMNGSAQRQNPPIAGMAKIKTIRLIPMIKILLLLLISASIYSKDSFFLNPGIKIGSSLGKAPTFILGFELSAGNLYSNNLLIGGVFGIQYAFSSHIHLTYCEVEAGSTFCGIALGAEEASDYLFAPRARLYAGYLAYLSAKYSTRSPFEIGIVGKFPLITNSFIDY